MKTMNVYYSEKQAQYVLALLTILLACSARAACPPAPSTDEIHKARSAMIDARSWVSTWQGDIDKGGDRAPRARERLPAAQALLKEKEAALADLTRRKGEGDACAAAERAAEEAAKAKEAADLEISKADPEFRRPALSAQICYQAVRRRDAIAQIAAVKGLAKRSGGGVVNLREIYELQQIVADAERGAASTRATLAAERLKVMPCSDRLIKVVVYCLDPNADDRAVCGEVGGLVKVAEALAP